MGGSCVDAAIAALLCEGIVSLHNTGIGGGHMMTIYKRDERKTYVLDARECAPLAAHEDLFKGGSISSTRGMLAACVPGEIMGLWEAHKKFGILPWKELFQPAINFAENGFTVSKRLSNSLKYYEKQILATPSIRDILAPDGQVPKSGEKMILPTFSKTLQKIASAPRGALELYDGSLTKDFISDIQKYGGIITEEDMARYKTRWADEIVCDFNDDLTLHSIPCPGSGVVLALILRLIENVCQFDNNDRHKILIEAFKHGYALRSHLADPSFTDVTHACDKLNFDHILDIKNKIKSVLASNETQTDPEWYGGTFFSTKNRGTISLAVVSSNGDAVAVTSTINLL